MRRPWRAGPRRPDEGPRGGVARTPTVLQMEEVECGAAALGMVLGYWGRHVPLEELRVACGVSRDGANAANIVKAARSYGMEAKGHRDFGVLDRSRPVPAIAFWNFSHFVVVEGFRNGEVQIQDPAFGRVRLSDEEFADSYSGIMLTFVPAPGFVPGGAPPSFASTLWRRLERSRAGFAYAVLAGLALAVPGILVPGFTAIFINEILVPDQLRWVVPLLAGLSVTILLLLALSLAQQRALLRLQVKLSLKMSSQFLWHLLRLPTVFFAQRFPGGLVTRVQVNDNIATLLAGQFAAALIGVATMGFYVAVMAQFDLRLTGVAIAIALLNAAALAFVARRRIDENRRLLNERYRTDGVAFGGLEMIETLKAQGTESDFFAYWAGHQARTVNAQQSLGALTQTLNVVPAVLSALSTVAVLGAGALLVMHTELTIGSLVAFQALTVAFLAPITTLVTLGAGVQDARGQIAQLDDVMAAELDPTTDLGGAPVADADAAPLEGALELDEVTFGYNPNAPPLIEGLSLRLAPGDRVALVGATGSGKSTVARLVAGLYRPWSGRILYDGKGREAIPRVTMTSSLAYVDQQVLLLEGSVLENLNLWDTSVPEEAIVQAAKDAGIHDVIAARPGGYRGPVEEAGRNFSGGQRQRLEIARALSIDPAILVLDEATSALDARTELEIDLALRRRGCTCLIVAHRLSTIRDADEIIVLEGGKVAARGTHDDLIAEYEPYRELVVAE